MRSSSTPKFLLKKIHKFFPNHHFDGFFYNLSDKSLLFPNRHPYRVCWKNHRLPRPLGKASVNPIDSMSFDGRWLGPIPLRALCTGAHGMAWLRFQPYPWEFHLMETRPELGDKKHLGQRLRRFASNKVLENWKTFVKQPPPGWIFRKGPEKHVFFSASTCHILPVFCFFVVWFPWVSPNTWRSNCSSTDLENSKSKRTHGTQECGNDDLGQKNDRY